MTWFGASLVGGLYRRYAADTPPMATCTQLFMHAAGSFIVQYVAVSDPVPDPARRIGLAVRVVLTRARLELVRVILNR